MDEIDGMNNGDKGGLTYVDQSLFVQRKLVKQTNRGYCKIAYYMHKQLSFRQEDQGAEKGV